MTQSVEAATREPDLFIEPPAKQEQEVFAL